MSTERENGSAPTGLKYWRSLDEVSETPQFREFLEREFPAHASEWLGATRRGFLKVMGASLALAGLASCRRWPEETLAPYASRPLNRKPGVPVHYATAWEVLGVAQGLLVVSYDGRPVKIEGNPSHPLNTGGGTDAFAQATVLQAYDPDRSRGVTRVEGTSRIGAGWVEFARFARQNIQPANLWILSEATNSPSVLRMKDQLVAAGAKWVEWEPWGDDNLREGARIAFGAPYRASPRLDKAEVILAIDIDLFCNGDPMGVLYSRQFAEGRRLHEKEGVPTMNRLYCVESVFTNTGASADHRRAVAPSMIPLFVQELVAAIRGGAAAGSSGVDKAFIETLAKDLKQHAGKCVIVAGPRQEKGVQAAVAQLNAELGNIGTTIVYYQDRQANAPSNIDALKNLTQAMAAGQVQNLLIIGGNPVYDAPADLNFAAALAKVPNSMHLGTHVDETSVLCRWHLSQAYYLEAWGDARTFDGTVSITQPMIQPMFEGRSVAEVLSLLAGKPQEGYDIVRETFKALTGGGDWQWKQALYEGVVKGTQWQAANVGSGNAGAVDAALAQAAGAVKAGQIDLAFLVSSVFDGRFANLGWLQEMPDPMTRITWDNAALMSPKMAAKLGVEANQTVKITANGRDLEIVAYVLPGMPEGVVAVALGYGREVAGNVGTGVGKNVYPLRFSNTLGYVPNASVSKVGNYYPLATVQLHHLIDVVGAKAIQRRAPELVKERRFSDYKKDTAVGVRKVKSLSPWNEHRFDGTSGGPTPAGDPPPPLPAHMNHKWGMAIDLTTCTGCSACVVACQAENNVPVVGKEQVLLGREMHWLRVDRYFASSEDNLPTVADSSDIRSVHQPVLCMHCENAPCEEVCPVAATTHSAEGINMMTYNRCIGTRYCSNNCPYKVRRFNFFDYHSGTLKDKYMPNLLRAESGELARMYKNPEVTVRARGVMEKCTYCVQRIENTRIRAKLEGNRPIRDGELRTACQQACPTSAITFGDLNDATARVTHLHDLSRTYGMLDPELNTKPRTQYITKIRNLAEGLDEDLVPAVKGHHGAKDKHAEPAGGKGHDGHDH